MMQRQVRVGLFVSIGVLLMGASVFLIGDNRKLWDSHVAYRAAFADVSGLKPGSPVRMGGVDVGTVGNVGHGGDNNDTRIYVDVSIVKSESGRVRRATVAKVANKGLLGDKMIDLTVAPASSPVLPPGEMLATEEPLDLDKYIAKFDNIAKKAEQIVENVESATRSFNDPQFAENIKGTVASLHEILDAIAHKDSAVHRLFYDPNEAQKIDRTLTELAGATGEFHAAMADVRQLTAQVRTGPGIAHAVLYDGAMSQNAATTIDEVAKDLRAIREGNGLAHSLVYGDDKSQHMMSNVNAMTDDLRAIVSGVRAGKGTIGGLLVDPSVYEDIKSVVGNMERNQVLRALVRYSIKADEAKSAPAPAK